MNANEFLQSMQALSTRYIEEYTRSMQRYAELYDSVAKSRGSTPSPADFNQISDMQKRYSDFVLSESPKVFSRFTEASISYYSTLADLGLQTFNGYVDSVVSTMESSESSRAKDPAGGGSSGLLFHGISGESASNAFLISNHRDAAIDVKFSLPEIKDPETGKSYKPVAKFTPAKCRLGANAERVIQCTLQLDKQLEANRTYEGSISVDGFPEMAMNIAVEVEKGTAASSTAGKKRKSAKTPASARRKKKSGRKKSG